MISDPRLEFPLLLPVISDPGQGGAWVTPASQVFTRVKQFSNCPTTETGSNGKRRIRSRVVVSGKRGATPELTYDRDSILTHHPNSNT